MLIRFKTKLYRKPASVSAFPKRIYGTKCTLPHRSGRCMSITPCGDHTQLSSLPGSFSYLFPATRIRHSTREKFTRHTSGDDGLPFPLRSVKALQGKAISICQP